MWQSTLFVKSRIFISNSRHFLCTLYFSLRLIYAEGAIPFTVYPKKYTHVFCFAVLCCGYTLTDFPISIRLTSLALWQSNDCPSASKATLMNMDKYFMWIHYERLHNHNKAKHNKTVCIFHGIYCRHNPANMLTDSVSKMDEYKQIHAKLLFLFKIWRTGVWKTIHYLSSRIRAFHHWKNVPLFAKLGTSMAIRIDREGVGVVVMGRFTNPHTKHMLKYHFQFFMCFVCSFFMSSLLSYSWGFMGPIP